jgi:probable HAF family extracellular repeat protein
MTNYTTLDDPLATAPNGTGAHGINDSGQIVGDYYSAGQYGFLYTPGLVQPYTTIQEPLATRYTNVFGINDYGQIVGYYGDGSGYHGFVYTPGLVQPEMSRSLLNYVGPTLPD